MKCSCTCRPSGVEGRGRGADSDLYTPGLGTNRRDPSRLSEAEEETLQGTFIHNMYQKKLQLKSGFNSCQI